MYQGIRILLGAAILFFILHLLAQDTNFKRVFYCLVLNNKHSRVLFLRIHLLRFLADTTNRRKHGSTSRAGSASLAPSADAYFARPAVSVGACLGPDLLPESTFNTTIIQDWTRGLTKNKHWNLSFVALASQWPQFLPFIFAAEDLPNTAWQDIQCASQSQSATLHVAQPRRRR